MVGFKFENYIDILFIAPLIIGSVGVVLFTTALVVFRLVDFIEKNNRR